MLRDRNGAVVFHGRLEKHALARHDQHHINDLAHVATHSQDLGVFTCIVEPRTCNQPTHAITQCHISGVPCDLQRGQAFAACGVAHDVHIDSGICDSVPTGPPFTRAAPGAAGVFRRAQVECNCLHERARAHERARRARAQRARARARKNPRADRRLRSHGRARTNQDLNILGSVARSRGSMSARRGRLQPNILTDWEVNR